jgi:RHS repeat-associated protein
MIPDIQGSVLATLDSGTGAFTKQNYLPYGKSSGTSIAGTFGYTGQRIDPESGLYDYRARMYHPGWGRFLQPDPLGTITEQPATRRERHGKSRQPLCLCQQRSAEQCRSDGPVYFPNRCCGYRHILWVPRAPRRNWTRD